MSTEIYYIGVYYQSPEGDRYCIGEAIGTLTFVRKTSQSSNHDVEIKSTDIPRDLSPNKLAKAVAHYIDHGLQYKPLKYNNYYHGGFSTMELDYEIRCLNCDTYIIIDVTYTIQNNYAICRL